MLASFVATYRALIMSMGHFFQTIGKYALFYVSKNEGFQDSHRSLNKSISMSNLLRFKEKKLKKKKSRMLFVPPLLP